MQRLAEGFANERSGLEQRCDRGDNVSAEDLRLALQRYRSFFDRLLNLIIVVSKIVRPRYPCQLPHSGAPDLPLQETMVR